MRRVRALALVGVAAAAACPDATWLEAENGKCYTLLDGASTRSQAECAALCGENVNASIVTIRSPAENAIAAALVDDAAFAWIGFYVMMAGEKRVWGRWASASTSDDAGDTSRKLTWVLLTEPVTSSTMYQAIGGVVLSGGLVFLPALLGRAI